jgi:predicted ATPase
MSEDRGSLPLRSWTIKNFKSVLEASVDLGPLTVLVGPNSSGKSSLIQSILLATQAAQSSAKGNSFPLNGPLVSVGGFDDLVSAKARRKVVTFGGVFSPDVRYLGGSRLRGRDLRLEAARRLPHVTGELEGDETIRWELSLRGAVENEPGAARIHKVDLERLSVDGDQALRALAFRLGVRSGRRGEAQAFVEVSEELGESHEGTLRLRGRPAVPAHAVALRGGVPTHFLVERDENEILFDQWLRAALTEKGRPTSSHWIERQRRDAVLHRSRRDVAEQLVDEMTQLLDRLRGDAIHDISSYRGERPDGSVRDAFLTFVDTWESRGRLEASDSRLLLTIEDDLRAIVLDELGDGRSRLVEPDREVLAPVADAGESLMRFLRTNVAYLGPLRQEPQVVYTPAPTTTTGFIGTKGEYTAAVLHAYGAQPVLCPDRTGSVRQMPLREAVSQWLHELEVAESLATRSLGRPGLEFVLEEPEVPRPLDLTSVGVGISQLVPVIVMCLLAPAGSLVLLEQPELHLHPGLQQRLGDFLLACALGGRQLIVETHSEYIVSRLRLRVAEDPDDRLLNYITMIYAERTRGVTTYRRVEPNVYGGISDWPDGFFDQTARESQAILRAALAKQRNQAASE